MGVCVSLLETIQSWNVLNGRFMKLGVMRLSVTLVIKLDGVRTGERWQ